MMTVELGNLAAEINVRLTRKERSADHRLAAGLLLRQAKALVPYGQWGAWCRANISRSRGEVVRLLTLAPEPKLPAKSNLPAKTDLWSQKEPISRATMDIWSKVAGDLGLPKDRKVWVGTPALIEDVWEFNLVTTMRDGRLKINTLGHADLESAKRIYNALPGLLAHLRPELVVVMRDNPDQLSPDPRAAA